MHVHPGPDGAVWAIGLAIVALVVGGIPLAPLGLLLSAISARQQYQWPREWGPVFHAAFIVQVSSVVATSPMCLAFVFSAVSGGDAWDRIAAIALSGGLVAACFAVRSWHRLTHSVMPNVPLSISTIERPTCGRI